MAPNTEQVVAVLRSAGLQAAIQTKRVTRPGFAVRQFSRTEIGVSSCAMSPAEWLTAMGALEGAGYVFTYRCDAGMGARVTR